MREKKAPIPNPVHENHVSSTQAMARGQRSARTHSSTHGGLRHGTLNPILHHPHLLHARENVCPLLPRLGLAVRSWLVPRYDEGSGEDVHDRSGGEGEGLGCEGDWWVWRVEEGRDGGMRAGGLPVRVDGRELGECRVRARGGGAATRCCGRWLEGNGPGPKTKFDQLQVAHLIRTRKVSSLMARQPLRRRQGR